MSNIINNSCIAEDTNILLSNQTFKKIININDEDEIVTIDDIDELTWTASKIYINPILILRKLYKLTTMNNSIVYTIKACGDQSFLVAADNKNIWKHLINLNALDFVIHMDKDFEYYTSQVLLIEEIFSEPVYNYIITNNNSFVVNSFITHCN